MQSIQNTILKKDKNSNQNNSTANIVSAKIGPVSLSLQFSWRTRNNKYRLLQPKERILYTEPRLKDVL